MQKVKYSAELKEEVVRQVIPRSHTFINLARRLRVGDCLLFTWFKKFKAANEPDVIDDMNTAPALLLLLARKRFRLGSPQGSFWLWVPWSALTFVTFLYNSHSTTSVDHLTLYWIPLQLFVWSCFPDGMVILGAASPIGVFFFATYSAKVYFVWLFFPVHSEYWLLYKFYPLVWLWN